MTTPAKRKGDAGELEVAKLLAELTGWPVHFRSKVTSGGPSECWIWHGARSSTGYGNFRLGGKAGKNVKAHRLAYELERGPIPEGLVVCHRCDNPPCCNPAHLFVGTTLDNVRDKVAKGRGTRGEMNGIARLTEANVGAIRQRCAAGETQRSVARDLGVSEATISRVVHRQLWGHVA